MTKYEKEIYQIVVHSREHLNAEQIFQRLKRVYPTVVFATVYNNLNKLQEAGRIRKLIIEGAPSRYDRVVRHDHLVCSRCGKLADITLDDLTEQLQQQLDTPLLSYDLRLMYIWEDCQKQAGRT